MLLRIEENAKHSYVELSANRAILSREWSDATVYNSFMARARRRVMWHGLELAIIIDNSKCCTD